MIIPRFFLIFFRRFYCFRWTTNKDQELKDKIILNITSIDLYDLLKFQLPRNDPSSFSFVPCALQFKGIISNKNDEKMNGRVGYFLISDLDFEEQKISLIPGNTIELSLTEKGRCFKFEKI